MMLVIQSIFIIVKLLYYIEIFYFFLFLDIKSISIFFLIYISFIEVFCYIFLCI